MIYHQQIAITKNMPMSSLGMLGLKKPMLRGETRFFRKTLFWKILLWLIVGGCLLVAVANTAQAASCAGETCHIRSTTIDFTVSSDDLTAATALITWTPYEQINGSSVTVYYTADPADES